MTPLELMRERRDASKKELDDLLTLPTEEKRDLNEDEDAKFSTLVETIKRQDERISELETEEKRSLEAAETRRVATVSVVAEPNPVYRKGDTTQSFFRDLAFASRPNFAGADEARTRLIAAQETRAGGDMNTGAGTGGEFAPPLWLVEDFVALARPHRVTADLMQKAMLPSGVSSINLPKVASGTTVAVQQTQNSNLSDTAMTTTSVTSGITTLGGKQIISMQLLQQSGIPFDRVILQDLAADYAKNVDLQVLYGSNSAGQLNGLVNSGNNTAFTTASPAPASVTSANSLYYTVIKAATAMQTSRFLPADAIVMHPRRWGWILGSVDANSRPFVIPSGPQFNGLGNTGEQPAEGFAGTFGSYNVYLDPNISVTANSATNQDEIYVIRRDDLYLWESPVQTASFDATYADQASILFRILGYAAFIPNRYTASVQTVRGTGLVTPS